jgi:DNA-binding response OmpR family regulator
MERILIVDDELGIIEMITLLLKKEGFSHIKSALDGYSALEMIKKENIDLIILDVMLPDINGFDLCMEIRKSTQTPIIFLTSKKTDFDLLRGFGTGGDDYITKPFNSLELIARVQAQLRRHRMYMNTNSPNKIKSLIDEEDIKEYVHFSINKKEAQVYKNGEVIDLTAKEYQLLLFFSNNPHQIFSTAQLYDKVWGNPYFLDDKTVAMYISKIRKKIEPDPKKPLYILTIRGLGYKFTPSFEEE